MPITRDNIRIDFKKSHGSWVWDKNSNKEYLDFHGHFSSLALGYNHPVFDDTFHKEIIEVSSIKTSNCQYSTDQFDEFREVFTDFCDPDKKFPYFHFTSSGALAVEIACKIAFDHCNPNGKRTKIAVLRGNFHGITGYGNWVTDRNTHFGGRFNGYPPFNDTSPVIFFSNKKDLMKCASSNTLAAVLIEPIQSTLGDIRPSIDYEWLGIFCKHKKIPLIVDEIQTGFGAIGKKWYSYHSPLNPDIIVFGKKSQVSGIMSSIPFDIKSPKYCTTFDGCLTDMIRAKYVIKAINEGNLIVGTQNKMKQIGRILYDKYGKNNMFSMTCTGTLMCLEFKHIGQRDLFVKTAKNNGLLVNPTGMFYVRMRPSLAVTNDEWESFLSIFDKIIFV